MWLSIDWWKSVDMIIMNLIAIFKNCLLESRHSLNCTRNTKYIIKILRQLRIWELPNNQTNIDILIIVFFANLSSLIFVTWCKCSTITKVQFLIYSSIIQILYLIVSDLVRMRIVVICSKDHWVNLVSDEVFQMGIDSADLFELAWAKDDVFQLLFTSIFPNQLNKSFYLRTINYNSWTV